MKDIASTVYIVDEGNEPRSPVQLLIQSIGLATARYHSPAEFLGAYQPHDPGCLVLDIESPGTSGLELQLELNRRHITLPVIYFTAGGDIRAAVRVMRHGAFDFIQRHFPGEELIERVREALARNRVAYQSQHLHSRFRKKLASLTPREREVLELLSQGRLNKVMAQDLGVSQRTVEVHRARVMEKMGTRSAVQLVRLLMNVRDSDASSYVR